MTQKKKKKKAGQAPKKPAAPEKPKKTRKAEKPAKTDVEVSKTRLPLERLSMRYRVLMAVGLLLLAVCVLYPELVFQNKVFLAGDVETAASFATPIDREIEARRLYPLWNPFLFSGMPSFGSLSYNPYVYPVNFLTGLLAKYLHFPNFTWLLFHVFLLGLGVFLLLMDRGVHFLIAAGAGILMMWMPNHVAVGAYGHGTQMSAVAYIPFALLLWDRIWRGKPLMIHASALVIVLGLQLLRAHIQISYYTFALLGLHLLFFGTLKIRQAVTGKTDPEYPTVIGFLRRLLRREGLSSTRVGNYETLDLLVVFGLVVLFALVISSVIFLPVRDYAQYSIRGASEAGGLDYEYATSWSLHPLESLTFIVPFSFGFGRGTYHGHMPFTDYPNYLGLVVVMFAVCAALIARTRFVWFLLFVVVVSTLVSFGKHLPILYNPLFKWLPYFNKFRVPVMVLIVQQIAFVLLFALGISAVVKTKAETLRRPALWCGIAAVGMLIVVVLTYGYWTGGFVDAVAKNIRAVRSTAEQLQFAGLAGNYLFRDLLKFSLILLILSGVVLLYGRRTIGAGLLTMLIIGVALVDAYVVDLHILHPERLYPKNMYNEDQLKIIKDKTVRDRFLERDGVIEFLEQDRSRHIGESREEGEMIESPLQREDLYRVFPAFHPAAPLRGADFRTNRYMNFGISSVGGYHAAKLSIYDDFVKALGTAVQNSNYHLLHMLDVQYVITSHPFEDVPFFEPVWQGSDYRGARKYIYRNQRALPRVFFVDRYRVHSPDEILNLLPSLPAADGTDLLEMALLEERPKIEPVSKVGAQARIKHYGFNEIRIDANLPNPAILMLSEVFYPRWKVLVDGEAGEIIKANYILRAVALPEGQHEIVFRYDTSLLRKGLFLSVAAFGAMLLILLISGLRLFRGS
ncbi:MAG: hypothetical protein JSW58_12200 [Candidatus Latescibacterota bacterium]|nr:MAG: hypothetical protein JSW58_12200 [Candidatus Latescibacterota bacterium]